MPDTNGTLGTATDLGTLSYYGVNVNNSVGGLIDSTTYDRADYFTFIAPEKGTYRFDIEALTNNFIGDVSARILNSNGDQIAQTYVYRPNSIDPHFRSLKFDAAKNERLYAVIERFESNSEPAVDKTLSNYKLFFNSFNYHPNGVVVNDLKPTYKVGSTMTINGLYFNDPDGWQDIKSGTFNVFNKYAGSLVAQDYSMTFTPWSGGNTWAQAGDVSLSLAGLPAGDYYAYAYGNDSKGGQTDPIYQEFKIVENTVPSSILVYDLKDAYNPSDAIALTNLYVADADGWADVTNLKMTVSNTSSSKTVDSSSFTQWSGGDTWAQGNISLSLSGFQPGDYNVDFVATDKAGATTSLQKTIRINAIVSDDGTGNNNGNNSGGNNNEPVDILGTNAGEILTGNSKDNFIWGKEGNDTLTGGSGRDQYVFDINTSFNKRSIGIDAITDFTPGVDTIVLDRTTFSKLKGATLKSSDFASVKSLAQAKKSKALITYVRSSGSLFYNENRVKSGFGAGGQFAQLDVTGLSLSRADIALQP